MSLHLTQPEEIDQFLMSMEGRDMKMDMPFTDKKHLNGADREGWSVGYVSPYRAAYMKSRNFFDQ